VEYGADEDDEHCEEQEDEEHGQPPHVTRRDVTHSLDRRTADVTRVCADVTDTRAVAVSLHIRNHCHCFTNINAGFIISRPLD